MNVKLGNLKSLVLRLWLLLRAYKATGRPGLNQRDTLHFSQDTKMLSTTVERSLQIHPFLKNKANFRKVKLDVNKILTKVYEGIDTWSSGKKQSQNKPKQSQIQKGQNEINFFLYKGL